MDYKEKYENALERARNIRFGNPSSATANVVCEEIFPEIRESDDERIRNEIIAFVVQSIHRGGGTPIPQEQEKNGLLGLKSKVSRSLIGVRKIKNLFPF